MEKYSPSVHLEYLDITKMSFQERELAFREKELAFREKELAFREKEFSIREKEIQVRIKELEVALRDGDGTTTPVPKQRYTATVGESHASFTKMFGKTTQIQNKAQNERAFKQSYNSSDPYNYNQGYIE